MIIKINWLIIIMRATKKITGIKEIAHLYNNFFFDLDGVLWQGNHQIQGSLETLQFLRKQKKNMFFVTNSSVRDRPQLINRFAKFGFPVDISECYPSSYIAGLYIREKYPQIKNIMVFGNDFLAAQLKRQQFNVNHVTELPQDVKAPIDLCPHYLDQKCQGVLMGWDSNMNFLKSCLISFHLQRGAKFFGTNPDKFTMIGGYKIPGAGSIICSVESATGIKAEISGKPNTFIIEKILRQRNLEKQKSIMIGDNLETDIRFGNGAKISTLCLLSGVTQQFGWEECEEQMQPTFYCESLRL